MKNVDVLSLGDIALDFIGYTERISDLHSTSHLKGLERYFGGRGSNFSASSVLFNKSTALIGAVGNDFDSSGYKRYLGAKGIDVSNMYVSGKYQSATAFIFNTPEGEEIFYFAGPLLYEKAEFLEQIKKALKEIREKAAYCTFDDQEINYLCLSSSKADIKAYAPAHAISRHSIESIEKCLKYTDILFLNEHEANTIEKLTKKSIKDLVNDFKIKIAILTFGREGSKLIIGDEEIKIEPCKPEKEVDSTGAGDSFAGSFISNYIKTNDPVYSAKIASATASFIVEKLGSQSNIPTIEKVLKRAREVYRI